LMLSAGAERRTTVSRWLSRAAKNGFFWFFVFCLYTNVSLNKRSESHWLTLNQDPKNKPRPGRAKDKKTREGRHQRAAVPNTSLKTERQNLNKTGSKLLPDKIDRTSAISARKRKEKFTKTCSAAVKISRSKHSLALFLFSLTVQRKEHSSTFTRLCLWCTGHAGYSQVPAW